MRKNQDRRRDHDAFERRARAAHKAQRRQQPTREAEQDVQQYRTRSY